MTIHEFDLLNYIQIAAVMAIIWGISHWVNRGE